MIGPFSIFCCNILRSLTKKHFPIVSEMKHQLMIKYLAKECGEIVKKYQDIDFEILHTGMSYSHVPRIVWTLWYSEDNLPYVVKSCLDHMKKSLEALGYEVRILDKDNISDWIDMSDIQFLLDNKSISIQLYSDVLRCRLLYKFGGFWIDSTIAILNPDYLEDIRQTNSFFTLRNNVKDNWFVLGDRWTSFFWITFKYNPFFSFLDESMTAFIKKHGSVFEYLHFDYTIAMGYSYVPFIKKELDLMLSFKPTSVAGLMDIVNMPFDKNVYEEYFYNSPIQKLTYKKHVPIANNESGDITFWGYLMNIWGDSLAKNSN